MPTIVICYMNIKWSLDRMEWGIRIGNEPV